MSDSIETTRIEITPNGPLVVHNCTDLRDGNGEPIEAKPVMALCRCGASSNKPFCDGSHRDAGFEG